MYKYICLDCKAQGSIYIYITPTTNDKLSFQVPKLDVPTMYKVGV